MEHTKAQYKLFQTHPAAVLYW